MATGFPDSELVQDWIAQFFVSSADELLSPGAMVAILLMIVAVCALAFFVASTSVPLVESNRDRGASGPSDWFGSACAWVCPWQPRRTPG